jgi:hypothetical protein
MRGCKRRGKGDLHGRKECDEGDAREEGGRVCVQMNKSVSSHGQMNEIIVKREYSMHGDTSGKRILFHLLVCFS